MALLNSDVTAKTTVQLFNVNETESYAKIEMPDTVVYELQFVGDKVNSFGDNRVTGISSSGKIVYDNDFSNVQLTHSAIDSNDMTITANKIISRVIFMPYPLYTVTTSRLFE